MFWGRVVASSKVVGRFEEVKEAALVKWASKGSVRV